MILDLSEIELVEEKFGMVSLYKITKESQYLYAKIRREYQDDIVYMEVLTPRKKSREMPFIPKSLYDSIKTTKRYRGIRRRREDKEQRKFKGRPAFFCDECEYKTNCTLDIPCEKRDKLVEKRELRKKVEGDDRFWKNGKPKAALTLCKSSRYIYRHKKQAGVCQGELCRFFEEGKCIISLDK